MSKRKINMSKSKFKLSRIYYECRWFQPKWKWSSNWTIFGISVWWASYNSYCYRIGLFGLTISICFESKEN